MIYGLKKIKYVAIIMQSNMMILCTALQGLKQNINKTLNSQDTSYLTLMVGV